MGSQERRQAHPQTMVDRIASQQTPDFVGGPQNNAFLLSIQGNLNNRRFMYGATTKAEILQLNPTQFPSLGIFVSKKVGNRKNQDRFYYISFKSCMYTRRS